MRALRSVLPLLLLFVPAAGAGDRVVDHRLDVRLEPAEHRIDVRAEVKLPQPPAGSEIRFVLHDGLDPVSETPDIQIVALPGEPVPSEFGYTEEESPFPDDVPLTVYRAIRVDGGEPLRSFSVRYAGTIHHPIEAKGEEYARSFGETPGTIQEEGVYLAGSTFWFPWFGADLHTYELEISLPAGWDAVSGGGRAVHERGEDRTKVRWVSTDPLDDIHIAAGKFTVYEDRAGEVATFAYLRSPDEALARKYLDTTAQYLEMYSKLLGPYPYPKFALVENFWETGYGMPSFTLLGPKVIRFPFILHSSYPHEILHNWWGNGVFVDYETGNWCEGLTAYLADHLIKEQRGQGAEYRRDLLQKYADYVRDGNDFPLTEFRSRHSAATQAVGYGKAAMVFHMLRLRMGDEKFVEGLRTFYRENKFKRASWADLRAAFEAASGEALEEFFAAWVERAGAPELEINLASDAQLGLAQSQEGEPFPVRVPVAVTTAGKSGTTIDWVEMNQRRVVLSRRTDQGGLKILVDPRFDLFRKVHREEIPASLGQVFGADKVTIILPSSAAGPLAEGYRDLADRWSDGKTETIEITLDLDLTELPTDRAVWIFGWDNRARSLIGSSGDQLDVGGRTLIRGRQSTVTALRHPGNPDLAVAFLGTNNPAALPGLGRKLPHYGKYGYLGFEGDEPVNVHKGQWTVEDSPLAISIGEESPDVAPPVERALAELPPLFSGDKMLDHVEFLTDESLQGRGCGSEGLARAATYIEKRFKEYGLQPGWNGGYRHEFEGKCGEADATARMVNLVGVLPGGKKDWRGQSLVVIAHYDHLGLGWPDVHEGDEDKIHPGADDNASGVAVILELARVLSGSMKPDRDVVFLAVAGEESGLQGARAYVRDAKERPAAKTIGALNLDTVGRLGDGKVLVIGAGSASEWVHIVRGAGYVTGVKSSAVMDDLGSSDHKAFLDAGVPAVQFFTGPHLDYHRPGDTVDKIDRVGMVRTATFVKEFVEYLAAREEPMSSTLSGAKPPARRGHPGGGGRRVSLGSMPDFEFPGPGYRLGGVSPGSPAEKAGLQKGDVIVRIGDAAIEGLRDLSNALKGREPGDKVEVVYVRDGEEKSVEVELVAR